MVCVFARSTLVPDSKQQQRNSPASTGLQRSSTSGFLSSPTTGPALHPARPSQSLLALSTWPRSTRDPCSRQQQRNSPATTGRSSSLEQPQPTQNRLVKNDLPEEFVSAVCSLPLVLTLPILALQVLPGGGRHRSRAREASKEH